MTGHRGRPVGRRLRVQGWLRTLGALHVGGAEQPPTGQIGIAVDGLDCPYIPGTGLAGALRGAVREAWGGGDDAQVQRLWGWAEGRVGSASRVVVRDAQLADEMDLDTDGLPSSPLSLSRLESRSSAGIDRVTGSAAHGFLHSRVIVPRGVFVRLELDVESHAAVHGADGDSEQLRLLLRALRHGQVRLGSGKTRGYGKVELIVGETRVEEQDLTTPAGLVAALGHGTTPPCWDLGDPAGPIGGGPPLPRVAVRVDWRPVAPLMVRAAEDGDLADAVPYTSADGHGGLTPVLPGSSLKGCLRAHAERIERTVRGLDVESSTESDSPPERSAAFRKQLQQLATVRALFGSAPEGRSGDSGNGVDEGGADGAAALTVDDCYATSPVPAAAWQAVLGGPGGPDAPGSGPERNGTAADADSCDVGSGGDGGGGGAAPARVSRQQLESLRDSGFDIADHVAIDRWTGGAAEGRLFSVLEPSSTGWDALALTLDRSRLDAHAPSGESPHDGDAALALLLFVLRDLSEGRISLGWGTRRGMGDIEVDAITLELPDHDGPLTLEEFLNGPEAAHLGEQWNRYLDSHEGEPA